MDFIQFEGEARPRICYTPYVYSSIIECSRHFVIFKRGEIKLIKKEVNNNVKRRRYNCT